MMFPSSSSSQFAMSSTNMSSCQPLLPSTCHDRTPSPRSVSLSARTKETPRRREPDESHTVQPMSLSHSEHGKASDMQLHVRTQPPADMRRFPFSAAGTISRAQWPQSISPPLNSKLRLDPLLAPKNSHSLARLRAPARMLYANSSALQFPTTPSLTTLFRTCLQPSRLIPAT
jgi:hypothetical protein